MISLSPPTICNSALCDRLMVAAQLAIASSGVSPARMLSSAREPHWKCLPLVQDVIRCVIRDAVILLPLAQCVQSLSISRNSPSSVITTKEEARTTIPLYI
uniref:Uncharacterized protein n=1 Tax=Citrobacter freundii TaxID=546 RepID=A0A1V0M1M6_CITFR|nr:hypothetical protein [Citrobacter freundii]